MRSVDCYTVSVKLIPDKKFDSYTAYSITRVWPLPQYIEYVFKEYSQVLCKPYIHQSILLAICHDYGMIWRHFPHQFLCEMNPQVTYRFLLLWTFIVSDMFARTHYWPNTRVAVVLRCHTPIWRQCNVLNGSNSIYIYIMDFIKSVRIH